MKWIVYGIAVIVLFGTRSLALPHGRRIVCYQGFTSYNNLISDVFNTKEGEEPPLNMCTHLNYLYAGIDNKTFQVISTNLDRDIDKGGFEKSVSVKKKCPHLSVMITIGAYVGSSDVFHKMAERESTRRIFINSAVDFLNRHSFDGMELAWYYPGEEDKENLVILSKELKNELNKHGLLYSMVVGGRKRQIDEGIDANRLSKYVDFFNVLSFQYHFYLEGVVGASASIYSNDELSVDFTIQHILKMGVHPKFVNMGFSTTFNSFLLSKPLDDLTSTNHITGLPSKSAGSFTGLITRNPGRISYYDLCAMMQTQNWTVIMDEASQTPFAVQPDRVISIENEDSYMVKSKYLMENKLGGVLFWNLEFDDFYPVCESSEQTYPMLRLLNRCLNSFIPSFYNDIFGSLKENNANYFWNNMKK